MKAILFLLVVVLLNSCITINYYYKEPIRIPIIGYTDGTYLDYHPNIKYQATPMISDSALILRGSNILYPKK